MERSDARKSLERTSRGSRSSANDRWKRGWGNGLFLSTLIGAAAHLTIFILIPAWEVRATPREDEPMQFVQFDPMMTSDGTGADGEAPVAASLAIDEPIFEPAGSGDEEGGRVVDIDEVIASYIEVFGLPGPSVNQPSYGTVGGRPIDRPAPPLEMEEVVPYSPRLALSGPIIQLPVIRNPTVLQRYLRQQYNPHFTEPDGNGHVSVAMWINERGAVEWTAIRESSGFEFVDEIARQAFADVALFTPARSDGIRVAVSVVISVPFTDRW